VGADADRRTDRQRDTHTHDETNSRFSHFCEHVLKCMCPRMWNRNSKVQRMRVESVCTLVSFQLAGLVALWSFLILISQPDTLELGLSSRLREFLPTVEISSRAMELATLCTLLASQDLPRCRKQCYFIGYVCYNFKVFILWQPFPGYHTNYPTDMNLDIPLYRYIAFGPNPVHINHLKNRIPNKNTSNRILEERWKIFTFTFSILRTTLIALGRSRCDQICNGWYQW
jgi:hypothetical protein